MEKILKKFDHWFQCICCVASYVSTLPQQLPSVESEFAEVRTERILKRKIKGRCKTHLGFNAYFPDVLKFQKYILNLLTVLEARWFRVDFPYSILADDPLKLEATDNLVKEASRRRINLLPILGTWTTGKPDYPRDCVKFLKYVENIVSRYSDTIECYEFWNEPNCIWFWHSSIDQYVNLLKTVARKIKEINPQVKLGLSVAWPWSPGLAWALKFIEKVWSKGGLKRVDFIGLHGYPGTWEVGNSKTWTQRIRQTRSLLESINEDKEIWVTEFGYYAFKTKLYYPHVPKLQTAYLKESYKAIAETGEVPVAVWYCLFDPFTFPKFNLQALFFQEHGFGLYTRDFQPKDPEILKTVREITSNTSI